MIKKIVLFPMWFMWLSLLKVGDYREFPMKTYVEGETPKSEWIQSVIIWLIIIGVIGGVIEILIHG